MTENPRTRPAQAPEPVACEAVPGPAPAGTTDGAPRRLALSPSRAADFKQCPLLYRFRAIDRLPEVSSPAQVRGTLVHAVLDRLYALPAAQRVPAAARALVAPVWAELCEADPALPATLFDGDGDGDGDGGDNDGASPTPAPKALPARTPTTSPQTPTPTPTPTQTPTAAQAPHRARTSGPARVDEETWLAGVDPLLDAYFALEDPRRLEPEVRELLVEAELESGLLLRGYVDRVDPVGIDETTMATTPAATTPDADSPASDSAAGRGPTAGGGYRVVDYKTGAAPGPLREARALFQMKFYALVLLLLRGRPPAELRLMYLTGPEVLHYVPDEEQLLRFGRMLDAMWVAIRAAGATGDFRPNPGPACTWCDHRARCPAWDGVPPPYPGWPADRVERDPTARDDGSGPDQARGP